MNRTVLTALAIATICIGVAAARPQGVGLGLMGGDPSGLSLKVWTGPRVALDAGLGYSYLWRGSALHIHGDVLWHTRSLVDGDDGFLPLYIGLGGRVKLSNSDNKMRVGVRVPFGVEYVFASVPLGLFLELVPVFDLTPPDGWFGYNSSIGFRYYFSGSSAD
jgi:hypothetical protein